MGKNRVDSFADYIDTLDAYDHPTTVHNGNYALIANLGNIFWPGPSSVSQRNELEPFMGDPRIDLTSYQNYNERDLGNEVEILSCPHSKRWQAHPGHDR
ncbi:MAG: hypothetical protein HC898_02095 [Phycisphaerales bacterium]|nr:hypothetical protein [Phycisphaerales bacterium]